MPTDTLSFDSSNLGHRSWNASNGKAIGNSVTSAIDTGRESAANGLRRTASAFRGPRFLQQSPTLAPIASNAAAKLDAAAAFLEAHDCERVMVDSKAMVTRNPGRSLLGAVALGFLFAMALKRNS